MEERKLVGQLRRIFPGGARRFWIAMGLYVQEEVEAQIKRGRNGDRRSKAGRSCLK